MFFVALQQIRNKQNGTQRTVTFPKDVAQR